MLAVTTGVEPVTLFRGDCFRGSFLTNSDGHQNLGPYGCLRVRAGLALDVEAAYSARIHRMCLHMAETTGIEPATLFRGDCFPSSFLTVRIVSMKMAEGAGIEPTTDVTPRLFSKELPNQLGYLPQKFGAGYRT